MNFRINVRSSDDISIHYQNRVENLTVKISKDNSYPLHLHRQVEIFYVLDGEIENSELIEKWLSSLKNRKVKIIIPARGEQLKLIKMCKNNAYEALVNDLSDSKISVLEELKNVLSLEKVPYYIEAYDISNLNGTNNVGGMVVFQNGLPKKTAYRKFKIK